MTTDTQKKENNREAKGETKGETKKETKKEAKNEIHFDYKNVALLAEYLNPHARILNRRRTALSARKQRELATAIKRARFMALMPYVTQ